MAASSFDENGNELFSDDESEGEVERESEESEESEESDEVSIHTLDIL